MPKPIISSIVPQPPPFMERVEWPEELWAVRYDDGRFFCLWECIAVCSSEDLIEDFLTALETDEEEYRGGRGVQVGFDQIRDEAAARGCDGLILVDVPEKPRRFFVR